MPDTRRELSALQTLYADNTSGAITAQNLRDGVQSAHGSQVVQAGTHASEPAAGQVTGDLYLVTDGFNLRRWDGSAWRPWGPVYPLTKPDDSQFAWVNQGSATVTTTKGGIYLRSDTANGGFRIRKKSAPATPYTITAAFLPTIPPAGAGTPSFGLVFRESSSGKLHGCGLLGSSTGQFYQAYSVKYTNPTTFSATYQQTYSDIWHTIPVWLRIADDGTNRIFSSSGDGQNFETFHSIGRTDFLTADEVGIWIDTHSSAKNIGALLLSWKEA